MTSRLTTGRRTVIANTPGGSTIESIELTEEAKRGLSTGGAVIPAPRTETAITVSSTVRRVTLWLAFIGACALSMARLVSDSWFHGYCAAAIVAAVYDFGDAIVGYVRFERERRARRLADRSEP